VVAEDAAFEAVRDAKPRSSTPVAGWASWPSAFAGLAAARGAMTSRRAWSATRARGVDAQVADIQELPFDAASFDCVAANWVLHHVPDLDRGIRELARILRPGGRLVAATLGDGNMQELWDLVGAEVTAGLSFGYGNGEAALAPHFTQIDRREANGTVVSRTRQRCATSSLTTTRSPRRPRPRAGEPFGALHAPSSSPRSRDDARPGSKERKRNGEEPAAESRS
jgi:SAM-dependent methyltransferase